MLFDQERFRSNIDQASTDDLLDRVTIYRPGMEPQALEAIEDELRHRGVTAREIETHAAKRAHRVIFLSDGMVATCSFCRQPAVATGRGWQRLFGLIPVFPRYFYYCERHEPRGSERET
jgi:hypothetical protein